MAYPFAHEAQPSAAHQQPAGGPHEVAPGDQLAPGRRIHLDVQINEILAHAGYVDVKMTDDLKDVWKNVIPAVKTHVKKVVPRSERIGRAFKFETLAFGTMELAPGAILPNGNIPMTAEHMPAAFLNELFHHPDMLAGMDTGVLQALLAPFLAVPGSLAPAQVLVVTTITHPDVEYAMDLAARAAPGIGALLALGLALIGA